MGVSDRVEILLMTVIVVVGAGALLTYACQKQRVAEVRADREVDTSATLVPAENKWVIPRGEALHEAQEDEGDIGFRALDQALDQALATEDRLDALERRVAELEQRHEPGLRVTPGSGWSIASRPNADGDAVLVPPTGWSTSRDADGDAIIVPHGSRWSLCPEGADDPDLLQWDAERECWAAAGGD